MLIVALLFVTRLVYSYPIKKFIKYLFQKLGFRNRQLYITTFITSLLLSIIILLILYGATTRTLLTSIIYLISFSYWLLLDVLSINFNSKYIKFIDSKPFRFVLGIVVFCCVLLSTIINIKFDKFYLSQLIINIL
jgi:hypothetical protein